MKESRIFNSVIFVCMFLLLACTKDDHTLRKQSCGNATKVSISFSQPFMKEKSSFRSELDPEDENVVHNVYLMIFNSQGKRVHYDQDKQCLYPTDNIVLTELNLPPAQYTFCLMANVDVEQDLLSGTNLSSLNKIETYEQYKKHQVSLEYLTIQRVNDNILKTGEITKSIVESDPDFSQNRVDIPLKQIDAKVRFIIETAEGISFKANTWSVYNAPRSANIGTDHANEDLTGSDKYFNIEGQPFESVEVRSLDGSKAIEEKSGFTFYLLPNTKKTKGTPLNSQEYKKRELQEKIPTAEDYNGSHGGKYVKNGNFIHADPYATYIVFTGNYRGPYNYDSQSSGLASDSISANNARYVVHLGYIDNDVNNWEANRNTAYTYKVKIQGINEVITEVIEDNEVNTAVEAKIVKDSNHSIDVDAPFSSALIKLSPWEYDAAHEAAKEDKLKFSCFTPYDSGTQKDYDWVRFIIHKHKKGTPDESESYPREHEPTNRLVAYPGSTSDRLLNIKQLIEVLKQGYIMVDGKKQEFEGYNIALSVYINEYYYEEKPSWVEFDGDWETNGWRTFVNQPDRKLFIHWEDESAERLSRDKQSSFTSAQINITQKAILTPYSLDYNVFEANSSAVGMEAIQEPASYSIDNYGATYGAGTEDRDLWNGVKNMYNALPGYNSWVVRKNYNFKEYLKIVGDVYELTASDFGSKDFKAHLECLKMNRDENGDGIIQAEELRWYTPSIYEYILLGGLGNLSVPIDSRLAPRAPYSHFYHYATSTRPGNFRFNKLAYFAEQQLCYNEQIYSGLVRTNEGSGSQSVKFDYVPYVAGSPDYGGDRRLYYRCARRLGTTKKEEKALAAAKEPASLVSRAPYKVKVYVDKNSIRPQSMFLNEGELPHHYEYSIFNRPTRTFYVAKTAIAGPNGNGYEYNQALKVCKDYRELAGGSERGWRLPNAKELQLMLQTVIDPRVKNYPLAGDDLEKYEMGWINLDGGEYNRNSESWQARKCYWSSTRFSDDNYVFGIIKGILVPQFSLVRTSNASGFIRCVKDAKD